VSTIYLTSASAVGHVRRGNAKPETAASVGPGRAFSIMRNPRPAYGEALDGRVLAFTPPLRLLAPALAAKAAGDADAAWPEYEAGLRAMWEAPERVRAVMPGRMGWGRATRDGDGGRLVKWDGEIWDSIGIVHDGDTLACSCGAEAARVRRCHRVIAADVLRLAGWSVVLDGAH
jgi:hypothetical protein